MGVQQRREREKEELRRKILAAASELFVNEGLESVSMRRIAEKVEYSPATIYLYFKDKNELIQSICLETFRELDARLQALADSRPDPLEGFLKGCEIYIRFGLEHPWHYIITLCTPDDSASQMDCFDCDSVYAMGLKAFEHLRASIRGCIDAGVFRRGDVEALAQVAWLSIHGLTAGLITSSFFPFVDRDLLIKTHLETLARGLRA